MSGPIAQLRAAAAARLQLVKRESGDAPGDVARRQQARADAIRSAAVFSPPAPASGIHTPGVDPVGDAIRGSRR